ncbi:MAG TPA: hypothetical protein EYN91_16990 [Candidatus Melainabacteria bacterium]|nr:hypothetical protein [Candidatus Melainabacteria bacterium]
MAGIAIIIGIFVFLLSGAIIGDITHDPGAGVLPGIVLGILAARPMFKLALEQRSNFLHPAPREYNIPAKVAFAKIRDFLAEVSYNYGDKWHVVTADTQCGRITANLRFTDEFTHIEADARGNIHTRKERLQRFIALNIHVTSTERNTTLVQLDLVPKVEGVNYAACDSIIASVTSTISMLLTGQHR